MAGATGRLGVPAGALGVARAVAGRPRLWPAALRQARVLVPARWWHRAPFLPIPDPAWLRFRLTTAYGDPSAPLVAEDVLTWLAWSGTVRPRSLDAGPVETGRD